MNQQQNREHFIPFYTAPRRSQPKDKLTHHKLAWLKQRKNQILYSPIHKKKTKQLILDIIENILDENENQKFIIKYNPIGDQIKYTSDHDMKKKWNQYIEEQQEIQRKKQKSEEQTNISSKAKTLHIDRYFFLLDVICKYCKIKGHYTQNCHKLNKVQKYLGAYICFNCNQRGHKAKECRRRKEQKLRQRQSDLKGPFIVIESKFETEIFEY